MYIHLVKQVVWYEVILAESENLDSQAQDQNVHDCWGFGTKREAMEKVKALRKNPEMTFVRGC